LTLSRLFISAVVVLFVVLGFYYWINHFNWYSDSFFIEEYENYTDMQFTGESEVIWKWAAPRGSDGSSHYVTAAIVGSGFKASMLGTRFKSESDCYMKSGGAKRFVTEASPLNCWRHNASNINESFFVLYAPDKDILLFKKTTH